jgi:tRNA(fMet)-specific endonuclease VapC
MKGYMLDTNTVSHLIKAHPAVSRRLVITPMASLCISAIIKGELIFGLAKRPDAKRLHLAVRELLRRVDVLPWDSAIAEHYRSVRADMERQGKILAPLDLLTAAHALSVGAIL